MTSPTAARFLTVTRAAETDGLPPFAAPSPQMQAALAAAGAARGITLLGPGPR